MAGGTARGGRWAAGARPATARSTAHVHPARTAHGAAPPPRDRETQGAAPAARCACKQVAHRACRPAGKVHIAAAAWRLGRGSTEFEPCWHLQVDFGYRLRMLHIRVTSVLASNTLAVLAPTQSGLACRWAAVSVAFSSPRQCLPRARPAVPFSLRPAQAAPYGAAARRHCAHPKATLLRLQHTSGIHCLQTVSRAFTATRKPPNTMVPTPAPHQGARLQSTGSRDVCVPPAHMLTAVAHACMLAHKQHSRLHRAGCTRFMKSCRKHAHIQCTSCRHQGAQTSKQYPSRTCTCNALAAMHWQDLHSRTCSACACSTQAAKSSTRTWPPCQQRSRSRGGG